GNAGTPVHWTIDGTTGNPASFAITGADGSQQLTLAGQPISMVSGASLKVHVTAATTFTSCSAYDNHASVATSNDGSDFPNAPETANCPDGGDVVDELCGVRQLGDHRGNEQRSGRPRYRIRDGQVPQCRDRQDGGS